MNRRRFFSVLAAGVAGLAIDPERLVWTPGAKTHILPPPQGWGTVNVEYWYKPHARPFAFHKDAFSLVVGPLPFTPDAAIRAMAKALADQIDAQALRLYQEGAKDLAFYAGDQWPEFVRVQRTLNPERFVIERLPPRDIYIDPQRRS